MDSIKNVVRKQTNSDTAIIPGGLTGHIQAADMSWNKPFKAAYKALHRDWMLNGQKTYTKVRNVRTPNKLLCLE